MTSYLYFNGRIRFYAEIFLDAGLVASINLHTVDWEASFSSEVASNRLSVAMIVLICILPVSTILLSCMRPSIWRSKKFKDWCGAIFEDFNRWKIRRRERAILILPIIFYLRRAAFIVIVLKFG